MRSLNLDQLRALLEVVEHGSFSAAARRLNLTQPAISLQIRELERRFGVQLIERLGKRAHATVPGRELVEAAQRILRECDHADAAMRRFREGWTGRVRVGTTLTTMIYRLPPILRGVRLDHPGIDLVVTNAPTPNSVENIIQNRIDLGLVNLPIQKKKQLKITPLCAEVLVAIFPVGTRDIPDEITPGYVARQNLLVEQASSAAHSLVLGWLSGHATPPRAPTALGTVEALKSAVASNLGMAIVPEARSPCTCPISWCGRCGHHFRACSPSSSIATSRTSPHLKSSATHCSHCERAEQSRPGRTSVDAASRLTRPHEGALRYAVEVFPAMSERRQGGGR